MAMALDQKGKALPFLVQSDMMVSVLMAKKEPACAHLEALNAILDWIDWYTSVRLEWSFCQKIDK